MLKPYFPLIFTLFYWIFPINVEGSSSSAGINSQPQRKWLMVTDDKLPHNVVVNHYEIWIQPYVTFDDLKIPEGKENTFEGNVTIYFSTLTSINQIELNSGVNIATTKLFGVKTNHELPISDIELTENQHLIITTEDKFLANEMLKLVFTFTGRIYDAPGPGLFKNCIDPKRCLLATHFQTIHAREVFPCFDDPFLKSTFQLNLIHHKNAKVYSNSLIESQESYNKNLMVTNFETTVKMSTYLLAFAIADFVEAAGVSNSGVKIRAIGVPSTKQNLNESLMYAIYCINVMEKLVNYKYPLKKLDHLDVVNFVAMENFGLAIYGGHLNMSKHDTVIEIQQKARAIAHETAHQWFGNIVTADRWGEEFLHESFANFFESKIMSEMPGWMEVQEDAESYIRTKVMHLKVERSLVDKTSHFDAKSYKVGGTILRQFYNLLGPKTFYKALNIYLKTYQYSNTNHKGLLASFEKALNHKPLCGDLHFTEFAVDYFTNVGYPEIKVGFSEETGYNVTQTTKGTLYNIPLFVIDVNEKFEHVIYLLKNGTLCSSSNYYLQSNATYIFNNEAKGFFFSYYQKAAWNRLFNMDLFLISNKNIYSIVCEQFRYEDKQKEAEFLKKLAWDREGYFKNNILSIYVFKKYDNITVNEKTVLEINANLFDFEDESVINRLDLTLYLKKNNIVSTMGTQLAITYGAILSVYTFRQRAFLIFERSVDKGIKRACKIAQLIFDNFTSQCLEGKHVGLDCELIMPEYSCAVYKQGAKTSQGHVLLFDYFKKNNQKNLSKTEFECLNKVTNQTVV